MPARSTGRTLSRERWRLIYGNRWRVASASSAAASGRASRSWRPATGSTSGGLSLRGDGELAAGIVAGWDARPRLSGGPR